MALTVKQLNGDASYLLTFEPVDRADPGLGAGPTPYRILLDPWIAGPSNMLHSIFWSTSHVQQACVASLRELPEPDLVIISHGWSDHCHESTLRQLPPSSTKTLILAEPAAAKVIRRWRYFDPEMVKTLPPWQNPRRTGQDGAIRLPVPPQVFGANEGEVTVSLIPQQRGLSTMHAAIGITYRPPPSQRCIFRRPPPTPPATPPSTISAQPPRLAAPRFASLESPTAKSSSLFASLTPPESPSPPHKVRTVRSATSLSPHAHDRSLSVIFSPHGTCYQSLESYVTGHLVAEAALPLTALLHCFDALSLPWWLGGKVSAGMLTGHQTAAALEARAWISTHDGDKKVRGLANKMLQRRKHQVDEVRGLLQTTLDSSSTPNGSIRSKRPARPTKILALAAGEEIQLTSEGLLECDSDA